MIGELSITVPYSDLRLAVEFAVTLVLVLVLVTLVMGVWVAVTLVATKLSTNATVVNIYFILTPLVVDSYLL
jgi:hypothetical protein